MFPSPRSFLYVISLAVALGLSGCSTTAPLQVAETVEQKAYASYGIYTIYRERAADVIQNRSVPDSAKLEIQKADARVSPVADGLLESTLKLTEIKDEFEAGAAVEGPMLTMVRNVEDWTERLEPVLVEFIAAVKGAVQ